MKTDEFRTLSRDLAMHIAASKPKFIEPAEIDPGLWQRELESLQSSLAGLDSAMRQARLREARARFERDNCLLLQPYIRDSKKTVAEAISEVSNKLKDAVEVVRFVRYDINEP